MSIKKNKKRGPYKKRQPIYYYNINNKTHKYICNNKDQKYVFEILLF